MSNFIDEFLRGECAVAGELIQQSGEVQLAQDTAGATWRLNVAGWALLPPQLGITAFIDADQRVVNIAITRDNLVESRECFYCHQPYTEDWPKELFNDGREGYVCSACSRSLGRTRFKLGEVQDGSD